MTAENPDRPGQVELDEAITEAINRCRKEWDITYYDLLGVLAMISNRYANDESIK